MPGATTGRLASNEPNLQNIPLRTAEGRRVLGAFISFHTNFTEKRQTGATTEQMKNAPAGAVFVWCDEVTFYPTQLARFLGRTDLRVVPKSWLRLSVMAGYEGRVVVDHALAPSPENYVALHHLSARSLLVSTKLKD